MRHATKNTQNVDEQMILLLSQVSCSGVASPNIWVGGKMFDFRRITLFRLEKHLSKHKMAIFSKNLGMGHGPFGPPWLRLWCHGSEC